MRLNAYCLKTKKKQNRKCQVGFFMRTPLVCQLERLSPCELGRIGSCELGRYKPIERGVKTKNILCNRTRAIKENFTQQKPLISGTGEVSSFVDYIVCTNIGKRWSRRVLKSWDGVSGFGRTHTRQPYG